MDIDPKGGLDKDDNRIDYSKCSEKTDRFILENTNDLFVGMIVEGVGIYDTEIKSIDCDKNITLSKKQIIRKNVVLTFTREWRGGVNEVVSNVNSVGQACVNLSSSVDIPHGTVVQFEDNEQIIKGRMSYDTSGEETINLTVNIDSYDFGIKNATYTLDLDNIISFKPNAYDQDIYTIKDTAVVINMIKYDSDANAKNKVGVIVGLPKNGTLGSYVAGTDSFTYTPSAGFTGEDSFTFTMNADLDAASSTYIGVSDIKRIRIIVRGV